MVVADCRQVVCKHRQAVIEQIELILNGLRKLPDSALEILSPNADNSTCADLETH
jgi:hypothetical protein